MQVHAVHVGLDLSRVVSCVVWLSTEDSAARAASRRRCVVSTVLSSMIGGVKYRPRQERAREARLWLVHLARCGGVVDVKRLCTLCVRV